MSKKLLTIALIGGGVIAGYSFYAKMKKTQAELVVVPDASIHAVNWDGIIIRIDLLLKNPTKGSFFIKYPFVKLTYKGNTVGSSEAKDTDIKMPAFGQAKVEKLLVSIPILSIFSVSSSILKAIRNKEKVMITATMMTTIDLGLATIPFEENHDVILKSKK